MVPDETPIDEATRAASSETVSTLLLSTDPRVLSAVIEDPALDELQICLLLERKDLSASLLDQIAKIKKWRASYRVRRALAAHPRVPRLTAMRLLRELHLVDLVRMSHLSTVSMELRRLAEERILAQLQQLPLGQKIMLARRGSARVAGELLILGPSQVTRLALDNSRLTESQLLKTLANEAVPAHTVATVGGHEKWARLINVRVALLRHPDLPQDRVVEFVAELPRRALDNLLDVRNLPDRTRLQLCRELARRDEL
jgi:hypothetical protein